MYIKKNSLSFLQITFYIFITTASCSHADDKNTANQSTAEMLAQGIITKDQKATLDAKRDRENNLNNSLQGGTSSKDLNAGEIALQLQTQNEAPDMACISNTGTLRIAIVSEEDPPFVFTNKKGELDGIDITLAKAIAKDLGVKAEFVKVGTYDEVIDMVINKKTNMGISKLSITSDRSKKIRYAGGYVTLSKAILVNRNELKKINNNKNLTIQELFSLPGAKIGVAHSSSYDKYAKSIFPKAEIVVFKTWDEAVDAMKKGEILAVFRDEWEVRKSVQDRPELLIYADTIVLKEQEDPIQMIVPWNSPQFAHYLDRFVLVNSKYHYDMEKLYEAYKKYKLENK